ncbi:MAG TPA: NADH-quinone oxidoreductase subunit C [Methanocorpusculum sp.]|nr:NADH-quinone oxidoreductase subunit C [Methanocorpusculum sp.]
MKVIQKSSAEIVAATEKIKKEGYRLVVVTCTPNGEMYDITYSFDKENTLVHYRVTLPEESEVPSICGSYFGAFVYENEIHDLYGFRFSGVSIDFKGTFIRTSVPYPFKTKKPEPKVTKVVKEGRA